MVYYLLGKLLVLVKKKTILDNIILNNKRKQIILQYKYIKNNSYLTITLDISVVGKGLSSTAYFQEARIYIYI